MPATSRYARAHLIAVSRVQTTSSSTLDPSTAQPDVWAPGSPLFVIGVIFSVLILLFATGMTVYFVASVTAHVCCKKSDTPARRDEDIALVSAVDATDA